MTTTYDNTCNNPLALCKTSDKEQFWLDNPSELLQHYTSFVPKYEMTRNQQLNAITRFCIYMIILILAFNRGEYVLILPISVLIMTVLFKKFHTTDIYGQSKELNKILTIRQNKEDHEEYLKQREYAQDGDPHLKTYQEMESEIEGQKNYTLKTGYYDSDNVLHMGGMEKPSNYLRDNPKSLYTIDELKDYEKNTCRKPTHDNPLMNPSVIEFGNGDPPAACNANDDEIKDNIKVNFDHKLFRNVDDLWERTNSQRQFYTVSNTAIPNNAVEFAHWLYGGTKVCKTDQENCLRYDDVRFRSR